MTKSDLSCAEARKLASWIFFFIRQDEHEEEASGLVEPPGLQDATGPQPPFAEMLFFDYFFFFFF